MTKGPLMETRDLLERSPRLTRVATALGRWAWWLTQRTLGRGACFLAGHGPVTRVHTPSLGQSVVECHLCGRREVVVVA